MPRTPEKSARNQEIVQRRLAGEKLEALATDYGLSKSRIVSIVRDYNIKRHKKKPPLGSEG